SHEPSPIHYLGGDDRLAAFWIDHLLRLFSEAQQGAEACGSRKRRLTSHLPATKAKRPPAKEAVHCRKSFRLCSGLGAELIERANQLAANLLRGCLLNHVALHQVNQLAVTQNRNRRRRRRVAVEVATRPLCGFAILPCEYGDLVVRLIRGICQRKPHARTHLAGCATAD